MIDMLLMLVVLGAINHQVTHILTVGVIFQDFREWVGKTFGHESKLAYLVRCHLCAGTWVGFGIAILAPEAVEIAREPITNVVLLAFAVALTDRIFNEGLALMSARVRFGHEWPEERGVPVVRLRKEGTNGRTSTIT